MRYDMRSGACEVLVIALDEGCAPQPQRLRESPGMQRARAPFYSDRAFIPQDSWKDVSSEILHATTTLALDAASTIGWFSMPARLCADLEGAMRGVAGRPPRQVRNSELMRRISTELQGHVLERFACTEPIQDFGGIGFNSPGLPTVTVDRRQGHLMGLHLDSWFGGSYLERLASHCRIVINIGPAPRWFLFGTVVLRTLLDALEPAEDGTTPAEGQPIGCLSSALSRLSPAVRALRLDPGQGYIAATEAVLHDASTYWANATSYNYQLQSNFAWLPTEVNRFAGAARALDGTA